MSWIQFLLCTEILHSPLAILRGTELISGLTARFYVAVLSTFSLSLDIRHCWSRPDRVSARNMKIWLSMFWTWSLARGQDSAKCVGLAMGSNYSYCKASKWFLLKRLCQFFSLSHWKILKQSSGPSWSPRLKCSCLKRVQLACYSRMDIGFLAHFQSKNAW